jgi:outer membrane protein assembly factor BamB
MNKDNIQRFELPEFFLQYNLETYTLLCKEKNTGKNLWIRKIEDGGFILDAGEDKERIFIAIESGDNMGQFLALEKTDGNIKWLIPGKAYMFRVFLNSVYLIFPDEATNFFLIKVSAKDGKKIWHYQVNEKLSSYTINDKIVELKYRDGVQEILDSKTGSLLKNCAPVGSGRNGIYL